MDEGPANNWYYEQEGKRIGPLSRSGVEDLISRKVIRYDTLLWPGHGDWIPADRSELSSLFQAGSAVPPPLPPQRINNSVVWFVAIIPILGAIIEPLVNPRMDQDATYIIALGYVLVNSILLSLDKTRLKAAGHKAPALGWVFLVPIYLWRRASLLNQKQSYSLTWIGAFVISWLLNPLGNPFGEALVKVNCYGTGFDTVQCQFTNEGSAPGTMCVDVVLVCDDGRHGSHLCSISISPGGADSKVANQWLPPLTLLTSCSGIEYENMKVTIP